MTSSSPVHPLDLRALFDALVRHGVEYLVVGGVAVQVHGHRRTTKDLDIVPAPERSNFGGLASALDELDARVAGQAGAPVALTDAEQLSIAPIVPPLLTRHGELHVLNEPKGAASYEQMRGRALVLDLSGLEVAVVGLDDLVRMKRASGRPEDLEDIAVLLTVAEGG